MLDLSAPSSDHDAEPALQTERQAGGLRPRAVDGNVEGVGEVLVVAVERRDSEIVDDRLPFDR